MVSFMPLSLAHNSVFVPLFYAKGESRYSYFILFPCPGFWVWWVHLSRQEHASDGRASAIGLYSFVFNGDEPTTRCVFHADLELLSIDNPVALTAYFERMAHRC